MKKILLAVAAALIAAACTPAAKTPVIDEAVTQKVLDHHIQTFKDNDLEGVMADYTEESILITPDRTFKGLAEIRENFVGAFKALPKDGTTMTLTKTSVTRDVAYMVWKATTPTLEFKFATDTFIIVDGKIVSQTYAGDVVPIATTAPAN
ncbi:MAG TPA: nuclear transport factor 2 family protein [Cyclobacteriaceae bacterium]|nr:nuclear transport factor 2 family protein [Cyclobacteriaceae bacterium]